MVRKKQNEPEIVEAEPLQVEPKKQKVETDEPDAEKQLHSPVKEPLSKKAGKKEKKTKKRVSLSEEKTQEEEKHIFQVQTRAAQIEQVIPMNIVLL